MSDEELAAVEIVSVEFLDPAPGEFIAAVSRLWAAQENMKLLKKQEELRKRQKAAVEEAFEANLDMNARRIIVMSEKQLAVSGQYYISERKLRVILNVESTTVYLRMRLIIKLERYLPMCSVRWVDENQSLKIQLKDG